MRRAWLIPLLALLPVASHAGPDFGLGVDFFLNVKANWKCRRTSP